MCNITEKDNKFAFLVTWVYSGNYEVYLSNDRKSLCDYFMKKYTCESEAELLDFVEIKTCNLITEKYIIN